jgi:hypothetical protein
MPPGVEFPGCAKTAADFTVGDDVFVQFDYGVREGVVVKVGLTRVTVRHAAAGLYDVKERSYLMERSSWASTAGRTVTGLSSLPPAT